MPMSTFGLGLELSLNFIAGEMTNLIHHMKIRDDTDRLLLCIDIYSAMGEIGVSINRLPGVDFNCEEWYEKFREWAVENYRMDSKKLP